MTQQCPKCGRVHDDTARRCDCGCELQPPPPRESSPFVSWPEVRGFSGRIGRSSLLLRFVIPWCAAYSALALLDGAIGQWNARSHFGLLSAIFLALSIYPWTTLSVKRLHDLNVPGWVALILCIPIADLLAAVWLFARSGSPGENQYGPRSTSAFRTDAPNARVVSRVALVGAVALMLYHVIFARSMAPVFANMFASVNLALPAPTEAVIALSRIGLLAPALILLDATVLLLWFRYARPTWPRLFLLAAALGAVTGASVVAMYLPIFDMINEVQ
jgi:uncharacterized membrane protein YhaH (DUF805 family)